MSKIDVSKCHFNYNFNCSSYKGVCTDHPDCYYKQLQQANEDIKQYSAWLNEAREENKQLEFKYNMLAKQYAKLQEQYQKVLKLAKENADSNEYCLRELEKDYEKATQKLVELGVYNV